jgi:integrase
MPENLSATFVKTTKKVGKYPDGGNLYLQVSGSKRRDKSVAITKSWIFRYSRFSKDTWLGLGPYPDVSLKAARNLASVEREKLRAGIDPLSDKRSRRRTARFAEVNMMTFADCAEAYIKSHSAAWTNPKHVYQWRVTLADIAGPVFGHLPVGDVDTALVMRCLEPIWQMKTETASRLRGRIESVLSWATVHGYREGDNPARWRGHLQELLPAPSKISKVVHHPALPYNDMGAFMAEIRQQKGNAVRALEFTILTAARTIEVVGALWPEFDMEAKTWTVPAERMKAKRQHRVPLSPAALQVIKAMGGNGYVFPGGKPSKTLSNNGMRAVLKRMGRSDITVHGFRSTFRDWCAETTAYPANLIEMALAHAIHNRTEAAYRRGDLFEKRRKLMNEWAKYCGKVKGEGTVTPLRRGHG